MSAVAFAPRLVGVCSLALRRDVAALSFMMAGPLDVRWIEVLRAMPRSKAEISGRGSRAWSSLDSTQLWSLRPGMERSQRHDSDGDQRHQHDHLSNDERRLGSLRRQRIQQRYFLERLDDTDEHVQVERHKGGHDVDPAPRPL